MCSFRGVHMHFELLISPTPITKKEWTKFVQTNILLILKSCIIWTSLDHPVEWHVATLFVLSLKSNVGIAATINNRIQNHRKLCIYKISEAIKPFIEPMFEEKILEYLLQFSKKYFDGSQCTLRRISSSYFLSDIRPVTLIYSEVR